IEDEERLADMIAKVAQSNNRESYESLTELATQILAVVPDGSQYSERARLESRLDTLLAAYELCRVNWSRVDEIKDALREGLRDSTFSQVELDRLTIAVEKSLTRFIPEELTIPYSVNYQGELTALASSGKHLLVGTNHGLAVYNGKRWRTFTVVDGLPSDTILCLANVNEEVLIGTAAGPARYAGIRLAEVGGFSRLSPGPVTAIGARSMDKIWMVMSGRLYYFDGLDWSTTFSYKVQLDETAQTIANRFSVYGTDQERQSYLDQYMEANAASGGWGDVEVVPVAAPEPVKQEIPDDIMALINEAPTDSSQESDVVATEDTVLTPEEEVVEVEETPVEPAGITSTLEPGRIVQAPFMSEVKGKVYDIYVGRDYNVWIGTEYGLLYFDGKSWQLPGYRNYRVKPEDSFDDIVLAKHHQDEAARQAYANQLRAVNDLESEAVEVDRVIKIYRNPNALPVHSIVRSGKRLYLATSAGLVEFDGVYWSRAAVPGLSHIPAVDARTLEDELWLAADDRIVMKASARRQLSFMHVKWLPELADDVYYEFLSYVAGTEGWGTFGGNITFITYGSMKRTSQFGDTLEDFTSYDLAATGSYGAALGSKLKVGLSAKVMYSKLSDIGTGLEKGRGTSTGFAVDFGMLYDITHRLTFGAALTNLGPKMAYIDASQADDLPRNLAVGFAYKLMESDYYDLLVTSEVNKIMVGLNDGLSKELQQMVINSGAEFFYANMFALRAGYIYDDEGDVKTMTLGVGLSLADRYKFDFSYIPSGSNEALKNTLRMSLSVLP
ncbi:MAG: PorV/PorQ family protein, partial [bacterium]